jgi:hypothetical protein
MVSVPWPNEYQKTNHHNVRNRNTNGARKTANIAA